jgi:hypothetical protein
MHMPQPICARQAVLEDPDMEIIEHKGRSREAWRCNRCINKQGGQVFELSFSGAIAHEACKQHRAAKTGTQTKSWQLISVLILKWCRK